MSTNIKAIQSEYLKKAVKKQREAGNTGTDAAYTTGTGYNNGTGYTGAGSDYLNTILQNSKKASADSVNASVRALEARRGEITSGAAETRAKAYDTSRLSAVGNAELTANLGLGGNMYKAPASGFSESSRIAQDIALQNSINSINAQYIKALGDLDTQIANTKADGARANADIENSYLEKLFNISREDDKYERDAASAAASAAQKYAREDAQRQRDEQLKLAQVLASGGDYSGYTALGMSEGQIENMNAKAAAADASERDSANWQNAYKIWTALGVASGQVAEILGVPEGTKTSSYYFSMLNQQAKNKASSGSGSRSGKSASADTASDGDFTSGDLSSGGLKFYQAIEADQNRYGYRVPFTDERLAYIVQAAFKRGEISEGDAQVILGLYGLL